jgi:hypothetical protein
MPLTVCLVVLARYVPGLHFLTVLVGDQPALTDEERIYQRLLAGDVEEAKEVSVAALAAKPLGAFYDEVLIPALRLAEQDHHAGLLSEDQEEMVHATARDLMEDLEDHVEAAATAEAPAPGRGDAVSFRALCVPLRDEADEISAIMIHQLLKQDGITAELAPSRALTGELVEKVESSHFDAVIVAIVPPVPPRSSRLLARRLRERRPELPILVGCFSGACSKEMQDRLAMPGDAEVLPTVSAIAERVRAIAGRRGLTPSDKPAEVAAASNER